MVHLLQQHSCVVMILKLVCRQGSKIQLELWKLLEEDARWNDAESELAPAKFNPDRQAFCR